jgi:four helix bundle protein
MQDFRNLEVWQRARKLNRTIYQLTAGVPAGETLGLRSQMRKASVSICAKIAEGCGRRGETEFRRFLDVSMGSAGDLECEIFLSGDLGFITEAVQPRILSPLIEIERMLAGLIASLACPPRGTAASLAEHTPGSGGPTEKSRSRERIATTNATD